MYYFGIFLFCVAFTIKATQQVQSWLPKIVWTFWQEPIAQDDYLMLSFQRNYDQKLEGWQIRHLNKENMWDWLDQIPGLKQIYYGKQIQSQANAKKADLIRLAIMHHFGGVWLDYTMILTQNLDWLFDLKNNPLVQNKFGDHPEIFIFQSSEHGDRDQAMDQETNQLFLLYPTAEIFFIAARPGNQFAKDWLDFYIKVIKNTYQKYGEDNSNSWIQDYAKENNLKSGGFSYGTQNYFECSISQSVFLQEKQKEFDKKSQNQGTGYRKLAVKYYNIWVMGTYLTAYKIHNMGNFQSKAIVNILAQTDMEYLKMVDFFPKYFVKLYHDIFYFLKDYLLSQNSFNQLACPGAYFISENSILYYYLLQKIDVKFYLNFVEKYSYSRSCFMPQNERYYLHIEQKMQNNENYQKQQKYSEQQKEIKDMLNKLLQKNDGMEGKLMEVTKQIEKNNQIEKRLAEEPQIQQKSQKQQDHDKDFSYYEMRLKTNEEQKEKYEKIIKVMSVSFIFIILSLFLVLYLCTHRKYCQERQGLNYRLQPFDSGL